MLSVERNPIDVHATSFLARSFTHPSEVLASSSLDPVEKRCILAAWASDAFAVESKPWLRQVSGNRDPVPLADILQALQRLDEDDDDPPPGGLSAAMPKGGDHLALVA
jgi:hypothetical protein